MRPLAAVRAALWARLLEALASRCTHPPQHVTADLLEGDSNVHAVRWCRLCGAAAVDYRGTSAVPTVRGDWRRPRPTWWLA